MSLSPTSILYQITKKKALLERGYLAYSQNMNPKAKKIKKHGTGTYSYTCKKASYTVEAAVVLPLFVGFMIVILFWFRVLQTEIKMQQAIVYTARATAACVKNEQESVDMGRLRVLLTVQMQRENVPTDYIDGGMLGISISNSELAKRDISLCVDYRMTIPIGFFGKMTHTVSQKASARKWCGYSREEDFKGGYVYVTATGEAYHSTKNCPYLDLSIQSVSSGEVKNLRNQSGGKYSPCNQCCDKKGSSEFVYITDYGEVYHQKIGCSGLKRSIYLIPLEEVGTRHSCNKCGGSYD